MSTRLVAGANHAVPQELLTLDVQLSPSTLSGVEVDISAFVLLASGKVRGDEGMVFYGQPSPGNGTVTFVPSGAGKAQFRVNLPNLAADIEKVAFTATIHENRQTFAAFKQINIKVANSGADLLDAEFPTTGMIESALILGEFYRRQGQWKFRAVGQGFAGGLRPLAEHFGVQISDTPSPTPVPTPVPKAEVRSTPTPTQKPISLSKITLDKARPTVSLEKKSTGFGEIRVNLNWHRASQPSKPSGGLFGGLLGGARRSGEIDLDVGCLFETQDGDISAIQALGNRFGALDQPPYIQLKGDDRTGAITEGEWLHINGQKWQYFKRILIYAFIYEGAPNWAATDGVVTVYVPNEAPLEVRLTDGRNADSMCAIVLLENVAGALRVNREVRYFSGHQEMDRAYHWGLNWRSGSK